MDPPSRSGPNAYRGVGLGFTTKAAVMGALLLLQQLTVALAVAVRLDGHPIQRSEVLHSPYLLRGFAIWAGQF